MDHRPFLGINALWGIRSYGFRALGTATLGISTPTPYLFFTPTVMMHMGLVSDMRKLSGRDKGILTLNSTHLPASRSFILTLTVTKTYKTGSEKYTLTGTASLTMDILDSAAVASLHIQ